MSGDKPPFDPTRWLFLLVAAIFGVASVVIFAAVAVCIWETKAIVEGRWKCDGDNRVFDLMATLISSALALYAGRKQT